MSLTQLSPIKPPKRRFKETNRTSSRRPSYTITAFTRPLSILKDEHVLVLADVENLRYSARDLGYRMSFAKLGKLITGHSNEARMHAFFTIPENETYRENYFKERGWHAHTDPIEHVKTHRGVIKKANSDMRILYDAGAMVSRSKARVVVLGTGDGDLASALAKGIRSHPTERRVVTMSLAGSTSWRIDARKNPLFDANIEIGLDCLHPL